MIGELALVDDIITPFYESKQKSGSVDLYETDTSFIAEVAAAGVPEDRIELHADGQKLTVKGHRPKHDKKVKYYIRERKSGKFQRNFTLPKRANMNKITAKYKQGILHVEIEKNKESEPKKIEISM